MDKKTRTRLATVMVLAAGLSTVATVPALADGGGGHSDSQGHCSMHANWELKASPDNNRIRVELRVDTNRIGQVWSWSFTDNGTLAAEGQNRTGNSGNGRLEVQKLIANQMGRDIIVMAASNTVTGETCAGQVVLSGR